MRLQPSLMFASKAGAYPSGATEKSAPLGYTFGHCCKPFLLLLLRQNRLECLSLKIFFMASLIFLSSRRVAGWQKNVPATNALAYFRSSDGEKYKKKCFLKLFKKGLKAAKFFVSSTEHKTFSSLVWYFGACQGGATIG